MLTLDLEVPKDRSSVAIATLCDGDKILMSDFAAASATPSIAAAHGNPACDPLRPWGHPPLGTNYWLLGHARNSGAPQAEYGDDQFVFYSTAGRAPSGADAARAAGLHGRRGLLVYGGALGADNHLRRTQGGIRLSAKMAAAICAQLGSQPSMTLRLRQLKQRTWWAFWRPDVSTPPLSATEPRAVKAPADEMSLLAQLLRLFIREPARAAATRNTRDSQREDSSSSSSSSDRSPSSSSDRFQGQGGQTAGGGASGGWNVAAGVAAGAGAALVVGAAMSSEAVYTAHASPFSDNAPGSDGAWSGSSGWGSSSDSSSSSSSSDSGGSDSGGSDSGGGGGGD